MLLKYLSHKLLNIQKQINAAEHFCLFTPTFVTFSYLKYFSFQPKQTKQ